MSRTHCQDPFLRRSRWAIPLLLAGAALAACTQAGPPQPFEGGPIDVAANEPLYQDSKGEHRCGETSQDVQNVQPLNEVHLTTLATSGQALELEREDLHLGAAVCAGQTTVWIVSTNSMIVH